MIPAPVEAGRNIRIAAEETGNAMMNVPLWKLISSFQRGRSDIRTDILCQSLLANNMKNFRKDKINDKFYVA